jgi:hypothetical protein
MYTQEWRPRNPTDNTICCPGSDFPGDRSPVIQLAKWIPQCLVDPPLLTVNDLVLLPPDTPYSPIRLDSHSNIPLCNLPFLGAKHVLSGSENKFEFITDTLYSINRCRG